MADIDGGLVPHNVVEFGVDLRLRDGIQGRRRLIQDDEGRVLIQRPGDGDLLGLAAGDVDALPAEFLVEEGIQPLRVMSLS